MIRITTEPLPTPRSSIGSNPIPFMVSVVVLDVVRYAFVAVYVLGLDYARFPMPSTAHHLTQI